MSDCDGHQFASFREFSHGLSAAEIERFSRQILVDDFGPKGQEKIRKASLLIVGAGGLGSPVALYCSAAGIGKIGIVDFDLVSLDNLHRQIAYREEDINNQKVVALKRSILAINSAVDVEVYSLMLDKDNASDIVKEYDIIADCTDNAPTRYLINDVCASLEKPLISGSALRWEGQLTVYGYSDLQKKSPCYRCIFPTPPPKEVVTRCSEGGVIGPVVGLIASLQALEIVKIAAGLKPSFAGKMFIFDGLNGEVRCVKLRPRTENCIACGDLKTALSVADYDFSCTDKDLGNILPAINRISVQSCAEILCAMHGKQNNQKLPLLIDLRPKNEFSVGHLQKFENIPFMEFSGYSYDALMSKFGKSVEEGNGVVFMCRRGNNSQLAVKIMQNVFKDQCDTALFRDVIGGISSWRSIIDPNFPML